MPTPTFVVLFQGVSKLSCKGLSSPSERRGFHIARGSVAILARLFAAEPPGNVPGFPKQIFNIYAFHPLYQGESLPIRHRLFLKNGKEAVGRLRPFLLRSFLLLRSF